MSEGKVVIIEPDPQIVAMLLAPFTAAGFEVEAASDGASGLALCRRMIPQAVLVDTDLPDMEGAAVARQLRATPRTRHVHLVLLGRSALREQRIAALELGANDFIAIPLDPDEVTLRVRNGLRRAASENLTDPVTGLPGSGLIRARLRELLQEKDWLLLSVTIQHLEPFEGLHGFLAAQEVLRSAARALNETVERHGRADDFLGYGGEGRFLIVTGTEGGEALVADLTPRLEAAIRAHHTFQERERGYLVLTQAGEERREPLLSVEVHQVRPTDGPFYDIRSLTEALG